MSRMADLFTVGFVAGFRRWPLATALPHWSERWTYMAGLRLGQALDLATGPVYGPAWLTILALFLLLVSLIHGCASVGPLRANDEPAGLDVLAECEVTGLPCQIGVLVEPCADNSAQLCATVCLSVLGQDPACAESPLQ
jgi:hypothetical protein